MNDPTTKRAGSFTSAKAFCFFDMGFLKRRKYATAAEEAMVATTMVCEVDSFPIMVERSQSGKRTGGTTNYHRVDNFTYVLLK